VAWPYFCSSIVDITYYFGLWRERGLNLLVIGESLNALNLEIQEEIIDTHTHTNMENELPFFVKITNQPICVSLH
jgi:hypothetical protein